MTLHTYAIHRPMAQGEAWEVRTWRIVDGQPVLTATKTYGTLHSARDSIPQGLVPFAPAESDGPDLVEVWL